MLLTTLHIIYQRTGKLWLFLWLFCMPLVAAAQEEERPVVDSVTVPTAEDEEVAEDETGSVRHEVPYVEPDPELRSVPDSTVERLKKDERFAYANDPAYWSELKRKEAAEREAEARRRERDERIASGASRVVASDLTSLIFYIILGIILVLIIYRIIVVNNLHAGSRRRKEEMDVEAQSEIDDDSLDQKIAKAMQANDYRLAVRYMYLKTLRGLNEKGWIRYHAKATNNEYITQVHSYGVGNEFRFLTHVYEYVWYGEFSLSAQQFERVHTDFNRFFNTAKL